jgi:hypothetical protein
MNAESLILGPGEIRVPRTKLSNKMKLAATLIATGYSVPETASFLTLNKAHLAVVVRSSLFIAEVKKVQDKFADSMVVDLKKRLQAEANKSLDVITEVRDMEMGVKTADIKRKAADSILKHVLGKGDTSEQKGNTQINIVIAPDEAAHLEAVEAEFKQLS